MKRPSGSEDDEDDEQHCQKQMKIDNDSNANDERSSSADSKKKSDWLRSAQLWNQTPDPPHKEVTDCRILEEISWEPVLFSKKKGLRNSSRGSFFYEKTEEKRQKENKK